MLFGEVWSREDKLSLKLRSIATISALIGKGITDNSLHYHLATARKNGVTKQEMAELLTHLAFYAGWPNAWAAFNQAKEVYAEDLKDPVNAHGGMFGLGQPNDAYAQCFIGQSYRQRLVKARRSFGNPATCTNQAAAAAGTFIHAASGGGQVLICVDGGEGWYQEAGKPAQSLKPGDVVGFSQRQALARHETKQQLVQSSGIWHSRYGSIQRMAGTS